MNTIYSKEGHRFVVDGEMSIGETIKVTVKPIDGYHFIKWDDGNTDNPRQITIEKCGMKLIATFGISCDKHSIFTQIADVFFCDDEYTEYEESELSCEDIVSKLSDLIGSC